MARRPKPWYRKARRSWFVTIAGVQHNLGPEKAEAHERFYQLMRQPKRQKVATWSLLALADEFLDCVQKSERSAATYEWYKVRLQAFLRRHPELMAADLKPFHVQKWVDESPDHSRTTKRNNIRAIKRCMAWAVEQGYLDTNPIAKLAAPSADSKDQLISAEQFSQMLSRIPDENFADLMQVVWETGCRPQESWRVEARHVDIQHSRWVSPRPEAKGKVMPRIIYLSETAREITRKRMTRFPNGPLFRNSSGRAWNKDSVGSACDRVRIRLGKIIMQHRGTEITNLEVDDFCKSLSKHHIKGGERHEKTLSDLKCEARRKLIQRRARDLAPSFSLYTLRHSWATNALQRGVDALTVAILMGHKDPSAKRTWLCWRATTRDSRALPKNGMAERLVLLA